MVWCAVYSEATLGTKKQINLEKCFLTAKNHNNACKSS